ncbi:MAG: OsmC family protein [Candidatus Rokubacteria bacterium]|nr:OsmC family protein [Candidatus Rokubacteria bacterium]MBI3824941.1 OsmC family protein [Candidatus Rokubacteria bacterium]
MSDLKIDTVKSYSSGTVGRALNTARTQHFVIDSPSGPNEALTSGEAFLAGVSSCGVTLVERHAQETGVPLTRMAVTIEGVRAVANPTVFQSVTMRFELAGVSQAQADALVETYKNR